MGRTLNEFIVVKPITEEKKAYGMQLSGDTAQQIRAKKGTVITAGEVKGVKDGDVILYDSARSFTLIDEEFDGPVLMIRRTDVLYII